MDKVSESGTGEKFTGESEDVPLSNPNPENVRRFDSILLGKRKAGAEKRGDGTGENETPQEGEDWLKYSDGSGFVRPNDGTSLGGENQNIGLRRPDGPGHGGTSPGGENQDIGLRKPDLSGRGDGVLLDEKAADTLKRGIRANDEDEQKKLNEKVYHKVTKDVQFGGDAILGSLRMSSEFHKAELENAEKRAGIIKSIGVEIAERVLASTAALNAKQEVRITLKNNVLPSTDVIVSKDGKMLSVNFFTSALESASLLATKQAELRLHLLNALHDVNDVDVNVYRESSAESGDSHDGRSRDEYVGDYGDDTGGDKEKKRN